MSQDEHQAELDSLILYQKEADRLEHKQVLIIEDTESLRRKSRILYGIGFVATSIMVLRGVDLGGVYNFHTALRYDPVSMVALIGTFGGAAISFDNRMATQEIADNEADAYTLAMENNIAPPEWSIHPYTVALSPQRGEASELD